MAMTGVMRPGHVALRVLDMDAAIKHYTEVLGLSETGRDNQERVYLKAWDEADHHSVVLRQADSAGMDYMGWKVDSEATLERLAVELEASPLATETSWIEAGELNVSVRPPAQRRPGPLRHALTTVPPPQVDKTFELAEAVQGHEYLEAGLSRGKLVYRL